MYSEEKLTEIFYSGQYGFTGDRTQITKIHFLLKQKYLKLHTIEISNKADYLELASNPSLLSDIKVDAAGGSPAHVALKILAQRHLDKTEKTNCLFEQPFCGYYPDVISTDQRTVVECGHTNNVEKIFAYFTQGGVDTLMQVPYPTDKDEYIKGYAFTSQSGLVEFLEFEQRENLNQIRNIIKNR